MSSKIIVHKCSISTLEQLVIICYLSVRELYEVQRVMFCLCRSSQLLPFLMAWHSSSTESNKFSSTNVIDFVISCLFTRMHKLKKYFIQNLTPLHSSILQLQVHNTCILCHNRKMCCLYINSKIVPALKTTM